MAAIRSYELVDSDWILFRHSMRSCGIYFVIFKIAGVYLHILAYCQVQILNKINLYLLFLTRLNEINLFFILFVFQFSSCLFDVKTITTDNS